MGESRQDGGIHSESYYLDGMTAYEKWFKCKPVIKHMRTFGSDAYKHVLKEKRKKMVQKSKKMIFVGYEGESTNYRLWDATTQKIYVSYNVDCNEITGKEDQPVEESEKEAVYQLVFGDDMENEEDAEVPQSSIEDYPEDTSESQNEESTAAGRKLRDRKKLREPDCYR